MIRLSCSYLPLLSRCPQSWVEGEGRIRVWGDDMGIGTRVHRILADMVRENREPTHLPDDVGELVRAGWRWWSEGGTDVGGRVIPPLSSIQGWVCEERIEATTYIEADREARIIGTPDLYAITPDGGVIVDWKTGNNPIEDYDLSQLMGYAYLMWYGVGTFPIKSPDDKPILTLLINLRNGMAISRKIERREAGQFINRILATIERGNGQFMLGDHCIYCPRMHSCPARAEVVRGTAKALSPLIGKARGEIDIAKRGVSLWKTLTTIINEAERLKELIRQEVISRGELVDEESGEKLVAVERKRLDGKRAIEYLLNFLTPSKIVPYTTITQKEVDLMAGLYARLNHLPIKVVKERFRRELEQSGAYNAFRVIERKKGNQTEGETNEETDQPNA